MAVWPAIISTTLHLALRAAAVQPVSLLCTGYEGMQVYNTSHQLALPCSRNCTNQGWEEWVVEGFNGHWAATARQADL